MNDVVLPTLDEEVRGRLGRRYGVEIEAWLDTVPAVLEHLARRWGLDEFALVRRGTVSLVTRCRTTSGRPAVLKVSPDRARINAEAAALAGWRTPQLPELLGSDPEGGALLLEAIEPGTALDESRRLPPLPAIAALLRALHAEGPPRSTVQPLARRVDALFGSGEANYLRRPDLEKVIPRSRYEQGRQVAAALAADPAHRVVLHGDLTPANVLEGGASRGLVAVDPAPCWGDAAFDAVDLLLWRADDLATLVARAEELADQLGSPSERLLGWCAAFSTAVALEEAEAAPRGEPLTDRIRMLLDLSATL